MKMKRLVLLAGLCVIAVIVLPATSAGAAEPTLTGACKIVGEAEFAEGLSKGLPAPNSYKFKGAAECHSGSETLNGTATVEGKGELACAVAKGGVTLVGEGAGPGVLSLEGKEYKFELSFVAAASNVALDINNPEGTAHATGNASFATSGAGVVQECAKGEAKKLNFTAAAAGTI
jgi:hypothetical protein